MRGSALWDVQVALFNRLKNDPILSGLVGGRVLDCVPENQVFPYVVLGEATEARDHTHTSEGRQVTYTLHAWSDYAGYKEVSQICDRLTELLDDAHYPVPNWLFVYSQIELTEFMRISDPQMPLRHGVLRVRVAVQEV